MYGSELKNKLELELERMRETFSECISSIISFLTPLVCRLFDSDRLPNGDFNEDGHGRNSESAARDQKDFDQLPFAFKILPDH